MRTIKIKQIIKRILPKSVVYKYFSLCRKSYGQAGQDFWVYGEVFNKLKGGFFVEVGSNDGITINNTFLLESKFQWNGICIEAIPEVFKKLVNNRRVLCINACINDTTGNVLFHKNGLDGAIIFDTSNISESDLNENEYLKLRTITLERLFIENKLPSVVDYISMDIEGAEWHAFKDFPFDKYLFKCMTIERPNDELRKLLKKNGYVIIKEIPGLDVFYIHESHIHNYQVNLMNFWEITKSKIIE